jgi:AraC family transcriptional regulator of adaptative response / DNA-3-methyladenine glycosylase II
MRLRQGAKVHRFRVDSQVRKRPTAPSCETYDAAMNRAAHAHAGSQMAQARAAALPGATHQGADAAADPRYLVLTARDARFDGRFYVGVTSTGIYCRPVCRVRTPAQRHCRFFAQAAQAEAAGFRPCLRCRPELAPGLSLVDSTQALGMAAAALIDEAVAAGRALPMATVAARLGVTDRHLRRLFVQTLGVSPKAYLDTRRRLLAKQLLTDTRLPLAEVAQAAGYTSVRRFHATFLDHYRMNPSALRRQRHASEAAGEGTPSDTLTCRLGYRPPYDIAGVMRFLQDRAVPGLEAVEAAATESRRLARRCCRWISCASASSPRPACCCSGSIMICSPWPAAR